MTTPPKTSTKPAKGGWAPGRYMCKCHVCCDDYIGDKRSTICADCEYKDVSPTPPQTPGEAARDAFYKASGIKLGRDAWWDAAAKAAIDKHNALSWDADPEAATLLKWAYEVICCNLRMEKDRDPEWLLLKRRILDRSKSPTKPGE